MRGVDVSDHLRTSYSMQMRSHKWWHKVLIFGFDHSLVNQYILYLEGCLELRQKPLSHMYFNLAIADYLVNPYIVVRKQRGGLPRCRRPKREKEPHGPEESSLRCHCVECGKKQANFCPGCGFKFMCVVGCYSIRHNRPGFQY
jgi:hypothetical protein